MKKYFVGNELSEVYSDAFDTIEEAEKELEENYLRYGSDGKIIEVEELD